MDIKKIVWVFFLILILFSFANAYVLAQEPSCSYQTTPGCQNLKNGEKLNQCCPKSYNDGGGLVPCGTPCCPCTLCDAFVLGQNVVNMLLFRIVPIIAVFLIIIGGLMMVFAYAGSGGPSALEKAKSLFTSVIIGLLIIYCAWLIVNLFLMVLGVTQWTGSAGQWWKITCG